MLASRGHLCFTGAAVFLTTTTALTLGQLFRLLRWRQARGAAARVTAARWGCGFGEARRQASTRFGRGEATRGPGIHPSSIVIPNREPRTFNARARETPGRRGRLGRVRVDGVAPGEDFWLRASAAATRTAMLRRHRLEPSTRRWTLSTQQMLSTPPSHKRGVTCAADASETFITTKC